MKVACLPKGITRLDNDAARVHGYRVRLQYRRGQPERQAWFGDHRYRGRKLALAAATRWIKEQTK